MHWFDPDIMLMFAYKIVNFLILAGILVWLIRKYDVIENVFGGYQRKIKDEIDSANRLQNEATRIKREIEQSATQAEQRSVELLEQAKAQAEREKQALIRGAEAEAERLLEQARRTASFEQNRQLLALQSDIVERALVRARALLQEQVKKKDHQRLMDEFLECLTEESLRAS